MNLNVSKKPSESVIGGITTDAGAMDALARGSLGEPFSILGVHPVAEDWVVRTFAPDADRAVLRDADGSMHEMERLHDAGVFGVRLAARPMRYSIIAQNANAEWSFIDPYQFAPLLGELDEHLISEGAHLRLWRTLGAQQRNHEGVDGAAFAVWAPDARRVSVIGDFNDWDGRRHPMRRRGATGVWELFVPGLTEGARYKYEVAGADGGLPMPKSDPLGFHG
jgi:1,4-alpha-glucan branching enzyme